ELRHNVTFFLLKGCQNGLAVMEKDRVTVTLGCYCAAPEAEVSAETHDNDIYTYAFAKCQLGLYAIGH
ncbi:hypothetical protein ElyMa_002661500, partial [Elysia marginata]